MKNLKIFEEFAQEDEILGGEPIDKIEILKTQYRNQFNKYYRAMNYRIMGVEIDALYNILVLKKRSQYELTNRHEINVISILGLKPDFKNYI